MNNTVAASMICAAYAVISSGLTERYNEKIVFTGLDDRGMIVEVWRGPETWTELRRDADDNACITAEGHMSELVLAGVPA